jgi:hypothetical protein
MKEDKINKFWNEFNIMWANNWYDGINTFNIKKLNELLKKHGIEYKFN